MERHIFKSVTAFSLILIVSYSCLQKKIIIPQDWRKPTNSDVKNDWRAGGVNRYLWFKSDLNGDGIEDQVSILISRDNKKVGIFAFVSQENGPCKTFKLKEADISHIVNVGVKVVPPGRYVTLCGKGGLYDCGDDPDEIVLSYKAIELFFEGQSSRYFYWDHVKNDFRSVSITD